MLGEFDRFSNSILLALLFGSKQPLKASIGVLSAGPPVKIRGKSLKEFAFTPQNYVVSTIAKSTAIPYF
jgi:hypothetical protein